MEATENGGGHVNKPHAAGGEIATLATEQREEGNCWSVAQAARERERESAETDTMTYLNRSHVPQERLGPGAWS